MIYFDNAATSRFKPSTVIDAIRTNLSRSANSGRSGHNDAIFMETQIENCRNYLIDRLGDFQLVFTKSCTEALNLGIFGSVRKGFNVVTTTNEHNSVLRPLFELEKQGVIKLYVFNTHAKSVDINAFDEYLMKIKHVDMIVVGGASNVTGCVNDIGKIGELKKNYNAKLLVDGAQSVPYIPANFENVDMIACPAHKGLHGVQGLGFLAFKKDVDLKPLVFGGTGTASLNTLQPLDYPEAFEAGTQNSLGIMALYEGAKWTYEHIDSIRSHIKTLGEHLIYKLKKAGYTVYSDDPTLGVISFNIGNADSAPVADYLNENGIEVRSGLHCSPLMHTNLGTLNQGAVRVSLGVGNTVNEVNYLLNVLNKFNA